MIELIPAIDIIDGRCVRLTKGDYSTKKEYGDPSEMASAIKKAGLKRLHVVDLDGAKSKHIVNNDALRKISTLGLEVDFGGGIKSQADIDKAFEAGASMVTIGSVAVTDKLLFLSWLEKYGAERIILGADVKDGKICVGGWKVEAEELLMPFLEYYVALGVKKVLCTDISKDGMLGGVCLDMYSDIMRRFPHLHLIASGGVSTIDDIRQLDERGIPAVVIGKAIYEGKITLEQLSAYKGEHGESTCYTNDNRKL